MTWPDDTTDGYYSSITPRTVEDRLRSAASGDTELDLHGYWLERLPTAMRGLTRVTRMHLYQNRLTRLPGWFAELSALTYLDIADNWLLAPPPVLSRMPALTEVRLHGNPFEVPAAVDAHVRRFNEAVRSGDFGALVDGFLDGAPMSFEGVPVGPFVGREAIRRAYAERPPDDTLTVRSVGYDGDGAVVRFDWDHGGSGTMRIRWYEGQVSKLTVAFDT